jgi:hypothetical protein
VNSKIKRQFRKKENRTALLYRELNYYHRYQRTLEMLIPILLLMEVEVLFMEDAYLTQ